MGKRAASKRKAILERKISEDRPQKPSPPPVDPGGKVYVPVAIALITFLTIVIYGQTLRVPALDYEDSYYLVRNPYVNVADPVARLWAIWREPYFANFHPVTTTSWVLDRLFADKTQIFDARPLRITHLLYAIACALTLVLVLRSLKAPPLFAAAGGIVFAVHPVHTEVVAWLSARKDLLSMIFMMLSFAAYLRARESRTKAEWVKRHIAAAVLNLLAVLSKPIAVILPALFIAYEFCAGMPEDDHPRFLAPARRAAGLTAIFAVTAGISFVLFRNYLAMHLDGGTSMIAVLLGLTGLLLVAAPTFPGVAQTRDEKPPTLRVLGPPFVVHSLIAGAASACTFWAQTAAGAVKVGLPLGRTLNLTFEAMLAYTGKTVVPAFLSASYTWNDFPPISVRGVSGGLIVAGLAVVAFRLALSKSSELRLVSFGIFWFIICFVPVSNLVPTATKMADRYLFLPTAGAILALMTFASFLAKNQKRMRWAFLTVLFALVPVYAVAAYERTAVWCGKTNLWNGTPHPDLSLWTKAVETHPDDWYALGAVGMVYLNFQRPEPDQALPYLTRALKLLDSQHARYPEGMRLDATQIYRGLGTVYLLKAQKLLTSRATENSSEIKETFLRSAEYLEKASQRPSGFAQQDSTLLRMLAEAYEGIANEVAETAERDKLRKSALDNLDKARSLLVAAAVPRDDSEFRLTVLAPGTAIFGRAIGSPEERAAQYRLAAARYEEAARLFPDDPRPIFYQGLCYERLYGLAMSPEEKRRIFDSANMAFRRALELKYTSAEYHPLLPYRALASLYVSSGDSASALGFLKYVQQSDPAYSRSSGVDADIQKLESSLRP